MDSKEVALYMLEELKKQKFLYQVDIVWKIKQKFGEPFYYQNKNLSYAISKDVLKEFRELTPNVVWDSSEKCWRFKEAFDNDSKRKSDF